MCFCPLHGWSAKLTWQLFFQTFFRIPLPPTVPLCLSWFWLLPNDRYGFSSQGNTLVGSKVFFWSFPPIPHSCSHSSSSNLPATTSCLKKHSPLPGWETWEITLLIFFFRKSLKIVRKFWKTKDSYRVSQSPWDSKAILELHTLSGDQNTEARESQGENHLNTLHLFFQEDGERCGFLYSSREKTSV